MSKSSAHLSEWTLEQLAEGMIPKAERAAAEAHVASCARCAAELDAYRTLFAALADLPRLAPSEGFSDLVMARVQVAPQGAPIAARLRRWLPATRKGWVALIAALLAPSIPLLAALAFVLAQPMVSVTALLQWSQLRLQQAAQRTLSYLVERGSTFELIDWARAAVDSLAAVPTGALAAVVAVLALGIPLSAWSLVRLVRKPIGNVTYAN